MDNSGLMRVRSMTTLSRRGAMKGAAALGALAATGVTGRRAAAATNVSMFGWQDYDAGLRVGDFLKREDIEVTFTGIGNNDEIISRLAAGGAGQIDIVTPYMGYIPFLAASDLMALGALQAIRDAGLKPGSDIAVAGFDDLEAAALAYPPLTTIRQDRERLGIVAAERALELIEHADTTPPDTIIPVELVIRASTAGV